MEKIKFIVGLGISLILFGCSSKLVSTNKDYINKDFTTKEVLLIRTLHFNNPGADVVKTKSFDILNTEAQTELEEIAESIKKYNPSKIFVEWPYDEQIKLDSLYDLYKSGEYFSNDKLSGFYQKNEIFLLAFRTAKLNNLERVYAIDYNDC